MKFKVIEGTQYDFEDALNEFVQGEKINVIDIKYLVSTPKSDIYTTHCALIQYEEVNN